MAQSNMISIDEHHEKEKIIQIDEKGKKKFLMTDFVKEVKTGDVDKKRRGKARKQPFQKVATTCKVTNSRHGNPEPVEVVIRKE